MDEAMKDALLARLTSLDHNMTWARNEPGSGPALQDMHDILRILVLESFSHGHIAYDRGIPRLTTPPSGPPKGPTDG